MGFLGVSTLPPCIISEYCPKGSLFDLLQDAKNSAPLRKQLHWARRLGMASDAAWQQGRITGARTDAAGVLEHGSA